jgi:hypothetical protein
VINNMGLNLKYVPLTSLQEYLVDKDTGLPLAGGKVYFWKDNARTIAKPIYEITGSPPNYSYSVLPNPVTLSSVGTFQDNSGNDIVPYVYPYDTNGNVELYYVTVYSAAAVFQFSREGLPNVGASVGPEVFDLNNYIPNPQFLAHNYNLLVDGHLGGTFNEIAQGGWFVARSSDISVDLVTFTRFNSIITNPTGAPKFACRYQCVTPHPGDTYKQLGVAFYNVNKFSSDTEYYTFSFAAQTNDGNNLIMPIYLTKYFGSGGSPSSNVSTLLGTITITPVYQIFNISFIFGNNTGKILGTNGDDDISLSFNLPPTQTLDFSSTDFILTDGIVNISQFPPTTDADMIARGVAGWLPPPRENNMDLNLPVVLTYTGLTYNDQDIGKVFAAYYETPKYGELECNGVSYDTSSYVDNIPIARLASKMYNATFGCYAAGTGYQFVTANISSGNSAHFVLTTNSPGDVIDLSPGGISPGFGLSNSTIGATSYAFFVAANMVTNEITVKNNVLGSANSAPNAGTSGFTVTVTVDGDASIYETTTIKITSIAALSGKYFNISNTTTDYYVWFQVDGVGVNPAPGGTGILVNILSTYDITDVVTILSNALNGKYIVNISPIAAAGLSTGSYFTFYNTDGDLFYVWYTVDGVGTDPAVLGAAKGIVCALLSTDTASMVVEATVKSINAAYIGVPELRGVFIRSWQHSSPYNLDPDANSRTSWNGVAITGNRVGTGQLCQIQAHTHPYNRLEYEANKAHGDTDNVPTGYTTPSTENTGGNQTNPVNVYVMYVIKF